MSPQHIGASTGFVVGMFFGIPQLGAAIGHSIAGGLKEDRPQVTDRQQAIADEVAETLSENRIGLWLIAAMLAACAVLAIRVFA